MKKIQGVTHTKLVLHPIIAVFLSDSGFYTKKETVVGRMWNIPAHSQIGQGSMDGEGATGHTHGFRAEAC